MASWLIYALGGGFGHLTRAGALARAASPRKVRILTNSPYAGFVRGAMPDLDLICFDEAATDTEVHRETFRQIESQAPDCLIVDTFPRGLAGELVDILASFSGAKIFVQRDLNPAYAAAYDLDGFVRINYDLIIVPGDEPVDKLPQTVTTAPWLIRSGHEVFTRDRARHVLGLQGERPCVIVCAAGNSGELQWYGSVVSALLKYAPACDIRCIAADCPGACPPECWVFYWPALELYAAADLVIGGAGYNTIYECMACGVPLIARPWPRKYDRQNLRASRAATIVHEPRQAVEAALEMLPSVQGRICPTQFHNGATEAVVLIDKVIAASNFPA